MIKHWLIYLASLLVCAILAALFESPLGWALLQLALLLPLFSLAVSLPAILSFRLSIACSEALTVGDEEILRLATKCRLPAPPVRGRIRITHSFTGKSLRLKPGSLLPTEACGKLICSPERVVCFDYLGLFPFGILHKQSATVYVRPMPVPMHLPADLESRVCRSWHPKPGGGFSENYELRLYRPGDSLNQIHWKLSAKMGKPMVREAMIPRQQTAALVLTLQGEPEVLNRKLGRLLWAGSRLLQRNIPFEIRAFTGEGMLCLQVQEEAQLWQGLDTLMVQPLFVGEPSSHQSTGAWQLYIGGDDDGE